MRLYTFGFFERNKVSNSSYFSFSFNHLKLYVIIYSIIHSSIESLQFVSPVAVANTCAKESYAKESPTTEKEKHEIQRFASPVGIDDDINDDITPESPSRFVDYTSSIASSVKSFSGRPIVINVSQYVLNSSELKKCFMEDVSILQNLGLRVAIHYGESRDDAWETASDIKASHLLLMSESRGVLDSNMKVIPLLSAYDAKFMIQDKTITGGMITKVTRAIDACDNSGVGSVFILNERIPHSVLFSILKPEMSEIGTCIKSFHFSTFPSA